MYKLRRYAVIAIAIVSALIAAGCNKRAGVTVSRQALPKPVTLTFQLELNQQVYQNSAWGEPPQLAIWLEDPVDRTFRTAMVTYRSGAGDWVGKTSCPVSLPYWFACYNKETGTKGPPKWTKPVPDAITCATPYARIHAQIDVPEGTNWNYYIEVNVSGDFNTNFPNRSRQGVIDAYGNGQPSLIYKGQIQAKHGATSKPVLLGRTDQHSTKPVLIADLAGITSAKELLSNIRVLCRSR